MITLALTDPPALTSQKKVLAHRSVHSNSGGRGGILPPAHTVVAAPATSSLPPLFFCSWGGCIALMGRFLYATAYEPPWGFAPKALQNAHLPSGREMPSSALTSNTAAREPQFTPAQGLCSGHKVLFPSSSQQRKPLKKVSQSTWCQPKWNSDKMIVSKKWLLQKKWWGFAIHFRNSHYPGSDYFTRVTKAQKLPSPPSPPVSAGLPACFHVHPHLSFLAWYYRNILFCSFHTLHSKAFLSTASCIPGVSSCV